MQGPMAEQDSVQPASPVERDLSELNDSARSLVTQLETALASFDPQIDALQDIPRVTIQVGAVAKACRLLKDDPIINAAQLMCLACVDYEEYFQLVYIVHAIDPEGTMVLKADIPYENPVAPSVSSVWRAADWYEREVHDLFGVVFEDHPNLAPLLLYEGFEGFPGRKEFPFHEYQEF